MIHDVRVEVTCDGENCREYIEVALNYVYSDYSGVNGHYDNSEDSINAEIERDGWMVNEDKHYCENCKED